MNAMSARPMNEQFAEPGSPKSNTQEKNAGFAFLREYLALRIHRYRGRLNLNVPGDPRQYRHFSTGC